MVVGCAQGVFAGTHIGDFMCENTCTGTKSALGGIFEVQPTSMGVWCVGVRVCPVRMPCSHMRAMMCVGVVFIEISPVCAGGPPFMAVPHVFGALVAHHVLPLT